MANYEIKVRNEFNPAKSTWHRKFRPFSSAKTKEELFKKISGLLDISEQEILIVKKKGDEE
jgi:hypothetical protein